MDRRTALTFAVAAVMFILAAWLDYIVEHRRSRDETIARLLVHIGRSRESMFEGEGITEEGVHTW